MNEHSKVAIEVIAIDMKVKNNTWNRNEIFCTDSKWMLSSSFADENSRNLVKFSVVVVSESELLQGTRIQDYLRAPLNKYIRHSWWWHLYLVCLERFGNCRMEKRKHSKMLTVRTLFNALVAWWPVTQRQSIALPPKYVSLYIINK